MNLRHRLSLKIPYQCRLTIGEVAYFEDITGARMAALDTEDVGVSGVMGAMVFGLVLYRTGISGRHRCSGSGEENSADSILV